MCDPHDKVNMTDIMMLAIIVFEMPERLIQLFLISSKVSNTQNRISVYFIMRLCYLVAD